MSTHNICFNAEIRKYYVATPSYLDLWIHFFFSYLSMKAYVFGFHYIAMVLYYIAMVLIAIQNMPWRNKKPIHIKLFV